MDTISIPGIELDTIGQDSIALDSSLVEIDSVYTGTIKMSKSGFDDPVYYSAKDSMYFDIKGQKLHLYGEAEVKYTTISMKAYHIIYHWETGLMEAFHFVDTSGFKQGIPEFKDGSQSFLADRMKYNFTTNKGLVYDVVTKENDMFIRGATTKFTRVEEDTTTNDIIYSSNSIFTTCNHDVPHYGIRSNKQKIVANKEIIIGPSVLEIAGVPTPLVLPFGFFPITESRSAGILIPKDYTYNDNWGYGIEDFGYYYPISEYLDAQILTKLYFNGTWGAKLNVNYNKKYKSNGRITLEYNQLLSEIRNSTEIQKNSSYSIDWTHKQSAQAHPTFNMGGNIKLSGNNNDQLTQFNYQTQTQSTISSNLRFSKKFPYTPFSLNMNLSNSQNIRNREMNLTLPSVRLQMAKIFPFEKDERVGKAKWYEDIYLDYSMNAKNSIRTADTTLFEKETLDKMSYGLEHSASTGKSLKLLKYFSLNPSIRYREVWNFQGVEKDFMDSIDVYQDTTMVNGEILSIETKSDTLTEILNNRIQDFNTYRDLDFSASLSTKLFSTYLRDKGWLRGLRHTITPNFSFSYQPSLGNFEDTYLKQLITNTDTIDYNFTDEFSYQKVSARERMTLSYSFSDIFEGKRFNKKDSIVEKFNIIKSINFSGNYDFLADSLGFSDPRFSIRTPLWKITTFQFGWSWSLYDNDEEGQKIDKFYYDTEGKLMRSLGGSFTLNTTFSIPQLEKLIKGEKPKTEDEKDLPKAKKNELVDLIRSLRFTHNYSFDFKNTSDKVVGSVRRHSVGINGNIPLTDKWNIRVGNIGWDFINKRSTYPDIGFSRDLHCWEMSLNWSPRDNAYRFNIRVKPGTLGFLELPYNRNPYETF